MEIMLGRTGGSSVEEIKSGRQAHDGSRPLSQPRHTVSIKMPVM